LKLSSDATVALVARDGEFISARAGGYRRCRNYVEEMQPDAARPGRLIQASAALVPSVSQQAFKHVANIRIAGVISACVTPISKIPVDGAGFRD
jgi:hypothetical protein